MLALFINTIFALFYAIVGIILAIYDISYGLHFFPLVRFPSHRHKSDTHAFSHNSSHEIINTSLYISSCTKNLQWMKQNFPKVSDYFDGANQIIKISSHFSFPPGWTSGCSSSCCVSGEKHEFATTDKGHQVTRSACSY